MVDLNSLHNVSKVRHYCIENNLFTSGDNRQYEVMFDMVTNRKPTHDIAVVIWICSITTKTIEEIESDLKTILE